MISPFVPGTPPHLVGRDRELQILRHHLDAALGSRGSLVLIGGEAGIGKTALAEALCREAAERGAMILVGHCYDLTETPPYGPWIELFGAYAPNSSLPALPATFATRGTIGATESQAALFHDAQDFFTALAAHRPLLLVLDDLHWADPASLDLLRFLGRAVATLPILTAVIYRADELTRRHPLYTFLPLLEHESSATRLDLHRLSPDAVRALIASHYRLSAADAERLVSSLHARAEGNAFFTIQLLRDLEETDIMRPDGDGWAVGDLDGLRVPLALRQVIDGRLARLGEEAQRLLGVASVIGQEVPFAVWAAVVGADEDTLLDLVERAVEAYLLEATGESVRFVHALLREALYERIVPPRRRLWHGRIADVLLASPHPDPDALARHLREAGDARAVEWLVRAGDRALQVFAWRSAIADFEAAQALAGARDPEASPDPHLLLRLARAHRAVDPRKAIGYLDDAERWRDQGHPALGCYALFFRGFLRSVARDFGRGMAEMQAGARAFDALPADEREALRPLVETLRLPRAPAAYLTGYLGGMGRYAEVRALCEWLLAEAERRPPDERDEMVGNACGALIGAYANCGRPEEATQAAARARAAYGAHDRPLARTTLVSGAELVAVAMPYRTERIDERRRLADEANELWARARERGGMTMLPLRFFDLPGLVLEGEWDEAWALCLAGRQSHVNDDYAPSIATGTLASLALWRGETEVAWSLVRERLPNGPETAPGETNFPTAVTLQRVAAALALADGDLASAKRWLEAHTAWMDWSGAVLGRSEGEHLWAQYHWAAGDANVARQAAEQAFARASEPRQPLALLAAHRFLGELDTDVGRFADALRHLNTALALADACAAPFDRALTLLALAQIRLAMGDRAIAEPLLDEARRILTSLGARPALARADSLAVRAAGVGEAAPPLPAGLTAREAEVLRLLAAGQSNRAIADALFLSEHTVHVHVRHIFQKTRTDSRAAATAFALRHGIA